jgi:hypothetical protein
MTASVDGVNNAIVNFISIPVLAAKYGEMITIDI